MYKHKVQLNCNEENTVSNSKRITFLSMNGIYVKNTFVHSSFGKDYSLDRFVHSVVLTI